MSEDAADGIEEREDIRVAFVLAPSHVNLDFGIRFIQFYEGQFFSVGRIADLEDRARTYENPFAGGNCNRPRFLVRLDTRHRQVRRQTSAGVQPKYPVIKPARMIPIEDDERFVRNVRQPYGFAFRQPVRLRHDDHKLLFKQRHTIQVCVIDRRAQEADVDLALRQGFILET